MNYSLLLNPWVILGFFGQFVFFLRFVVQIFVSEKKKQSVVPESFWWISIAGTIIILIYSIHIRDIVFTTANVLQFVIYIRNLVLIKRRKV